MKKMIFAVLLSVFMQFYPCFCADFIIEKGERFYIKHYVPADQIFLNEQGIWINMGKLTVEVEGIYYDQEGFYYLNEDDGVTWICPYCGHKNSLDDSTCERCNE